MRRHQPSSAAIAPRKVINRRAASLRTSERGVLLQRLLECQLNPVLDRLDGSAAEASTRCRSLRRVHRPKSEWS